MGGITSKSPRSLTSFSVHILQSLTVESNRIRRLDLWFTRIVPRLYIRKEEWKNYLTNGQASAKEPYSTIPNDFLFARLWDMLKQTQRDKFKGYFKQLEEHEAAANQDWRNDTDFHAMLDEEDRDRSDLLQDLLPQGDIFDSTDFIMFYSQNFDSPEFLFDILAENEEKGDGSSNSDSDSFVTRECLEKCGGDLSQRDVPAKMNRVEFAAVAAEDPELRGCFGIIEVIRRYLSDADAMFVSGRPMSGLVMKKTSTLEWVPRIATVENGFLWYTKSGSGDSAAKVVPLEGAIIQRTFADAEDSDEADQDLEGTAHTETSDAAAGRPFEHGFTFTVTVGAWTHEFMARSDLEREAWMHAFIEATRRPEDNRYGSFSPVRRKVHAKWFVDGHDYFAAVAKALRAARNDIFIAGWIISHALYLVRDGNPPSANDRLDVILNRKASEGVKVFILAWNETKIAMDLGSDEMEQAFTSINKNIHVIKHPAAFPLYWSHHQKIVVVDQSVAFLGGIDLAYGRYDTPEHVISDSCDLCPTWPGNDYNNSAVHDLWNSHNTAPLQGYIDRLRYPRMPWHDVAIALDGDAAADVAWNFIQRWVHHAREMELDVPLIRPASHLQCPDPESLSVSKLWNKDDEEEKGDDVMEVECQIVRSIGEWSGGYRKEHSYEEAISAAILGAESFVYIENQFFTSLAGHMHNHIGNALLARLRRAIRGDEPFRVIVLIPAHPEGVLDSPNVLRTLDYEYETICRTEHSLFGTLLAEFPDVSLRRFIFFGSLRNWGRLVPGDSAWPPVMQNMIYVHSKLLIADDRIAVVGSANINDRSLQGDRDSELGVVVRSETFVHAVRVQLWTEHLAPRTQEEVEAVERGSVVEAGFELFRTRARANTEAYEKVFGNVFPSDNIRSLTQLSAHEWAQRKELTPGEAEEILGKEVVGHCVEFPLRFLEQEDFSVSLLDKESILDDKLYQ